MPTLNTKIYVTSNGSIKEQTTVRDAISLGQGKAYEVLKSLDCWEELYAKFMEETYTDKITPHIYNHTLESKIHFMNSDGSMSEETTVRDAIAVGKGTPYEVVKDMLADQ
jgi:ABC-type cobalamin/Fe3+-siderophores transport system ATPase subunit